MIRYFFDTDVCVDIVRKKAHVSMAGFRQFSPDALGISSITLAELLFGVEHSGNPVVNMVGLLEFCALFRIMPFESPAARIYGRIRSHLQRLGMSIRPLDTLIAAHALAEGAALVTGNLREFRRVPRLEVIPWKP